MTILLLFLSVSTWLSQQQGIQPSPKVLEACAVVSKVLSDVPVVSLEQSNVLVEDERSHRKGDGCQVRLLGSRPEFAGGDTPDQQVRTVLPVSGWLEDYDYGADGPDGTAFALRKDTVLCQFRAMWDGGDITDSTYVPDPRYELVARCMEDSQ